MKLLAGLLLIPAMVWALTNEETTTSTYTSKDFMGFCTDHNQKEKFYARGVCDSLSEALVKKECTKGGGGGEGGKNFDQIIEEIRKRYLGTFQGPPDKDPSKPTSVGLHGCSAWGEAVKDAGKFRSLMKQFMMAVAIQQSNLDPLANIQNQPGTDTQPDTARGFFGLKTTDMSKPEYKCGCANANSDGKDGPERRPGSRDEHDSTVCATYMALHHILEDRTLFGGETPKPGEPPTDANKPKGAAKVFPALMSHGTEPDPAKPGETREKNPKLRNLYDKLGFYCEKLTKPDGTLRNFDNQTSPVPATP